MSWKSFKQPIGRKLFRHAGPPTFTQAAIWWASALITLAVFFLTLPQNSPAQTNATQTGLLSPTTANTVSIGPVVSQVATASPALNATNGPMVSHATVSNPVPAVTNAPVPKATEQPDYSKYAAVLISLVALGYTVWKDHRTNRRMKKIEAEQERERQEAALRRSKASAPYFTPSKELFNMLFESRDDGGLGAWTFDKANVLTAQRKEIPKDAPEGTPVIIILNMSGKGARRIRISGDIPDFELKQEPETHGAKGRVFSKYPYKPSQHGMAQKVIVSFETEDGFDLTHTYTTRHGCFEFYRVDPR
jgi:hypothetical protein